jgi:hypothetical protein
LPVLVILLFGLLCAALAKPAGSWAAASSAEYRIPAEVTTVATDGGAVSTVMLLDVEGILVAMPPALVVGLTDGQPVTVTFTAPAGWSADQVIAAAGHRSNGPDPDVRVVAVQPVTMPGAEPTGPSSGTGQRGGTVHAAGVFGVHHLTVLPVYWNQPDGQTLATLSALADAAAAYWRAQSGGQISVTASTRDWARIADPGSCDTATLYNRALAANGMAAPTSRYEHVMVYFPERADCDGWAGQAEIGRSALWDNGVAVVDVPAHEFGHNLGLGHAQAAICTRSGVRVALSSTCQVLEYRDYADVMGLAMQRVTGNLNAGLADRLGLLRSVTVAAGTRATVTLAPMGQVDAVRAVKIRVSAGWVYVEYRPATGNDLRWPDWAGVQARLLPDDPYPESQLLDEQPGLAQQFQASSLPPMTPWTVPGAGLTVTVVAETSDAAQVEIAPVATDAAVPTPVLTAPSGGAVVGASTVVRWRVGAAVADVALVVDGVARTPIAAPALTGTFALTGLAAGRHTVAVQAFDASGAAGPTSAVAAFTVDRTGPTPPAVSHVTGGARSGALTVSWLGATDRESGIRQYQVSLNGTRVATTPAGARAVVIRTKLRTGHPVTVRVVAVDGVGLIATSRPVTVKV